MFLVSKFGRGGGSLGCFRWGSSSRLKASTSLRVNGPAYLGSEWDSRETVALDGDIRFYRK